MEVPQRRGHQSRAENGPSYQSPPSKERSDGGMSKQDLLQRLKANRNRHNDQLVSRTTRSSEMQPNGPIPTGRPQASLSPTGRPQRSLSPAGIPLSGTSPTGRPQSGSSPPGWRPQSGTSPTGRPPSGTSPNGRPQSGTSPPRRPVSDTGHTGRPISGTSPTERPHNGQAPNFVRVEVEVHAKMTPEQTLEKRGVRRRRRSTQPQSGIGSNIPEQQTNGPVAPPRRRYSTDSITKDNTSPDSKQQDIKKEESIPKPVPRPRRSQSQDRGIAQQKRSDAEKQFLLKQYELLQKQKQQQIEKERQQRSTRDMQKVKVQQELQLLSEQEQRVVHKLQKFENGASTDHNVNWVRKQQEMFDRQHDVKIQRNKKHQYLEATNTTVPNVQQLQQQAQHPQPAQRQRRRRPQPESKPQEQQQSTQQTKYKPPPVMPKPKSPEQMMAQSVTRQKPSNQNQYYKVQQQQLLQQSEKMRLQERMRHQHHQSKQEFSPTQLQVSEHNDQRNRRSSPRNSETSNQSHSSSDSSEVRLLHYKRRGSIGDVEPSKEHTKPQIKNPVARLSQVLRKGTSSPAPQKQNENNVANNLRSVLEQTKPASSKKEGISSQEMEEIIKRTAERMKREQQQMREAEARLNSSQERPRRRRRESQGIGESKMQQQTTTGNENRVTNIKAGSSSLDVYNATHADMTKPRDQGLHRVNDRKDNLVAESKTSIQINVDPEMGSGVRSGTDESDGYGGVAMVTKIPHKKPDHDTETRGKLGVSKELDNDPKLILEDEKIRKLSAIEEESASRSESRQNSIGGAVISSEGNAIQSDGEDKALDEALGLLHELASTQVTTDPKSLALSNKVSQVNVKSHESKSRENKYHDKRPTSPVSVIESTSLETQSKISENKSPDNRSSSSTPQGIETRSLENKLTAHNNESTDGQVSSLHGKPISDGVKVSPERALATSLPDSVIRNVSGEDTRVDKAQTEETVLSRNKQREEIQPIGNATIGTIEKRHEDLSRTVTPIPEVIQGEPGEDGIALRRKRFVKQVSFHSQSEKLQQVIGEADKESPPEEKSQIETSPDSPKRGILARGRFSGKREHPSLSKQTGEMYRRPKSAIFDVAIRKQPESKEKNDGGRQRPMSALYISEGDNDPMDRGRQLPKHYRPQSDSLLQLDKFDSLQIKPKLRRDRSPSPGLRGFTSPVTQRKLRDRRRTTQRMLPPPSNTLRMPRQPRPGRMAVIVESLKNGLLDSIRTSNEKLEMMKDHQEETKTTDKSRQGFHYNLDKQTKAAERFIRKLQFHLAKVEELQELYEKELKVREGAVNMVKAYHDANSPKAKEPVSEAKVGVRDCTQALCHMEAELEANLGAFVLKIEGIAGFARVTRGDIFEITFKYGFQKWKTKCKVEKDLSQTWEGDEIVLYPMVGDFLTIKVTEIRGIARSNVTIGNLEFDTSDFYGAEPQNLTIDVNETGTIKLNIIVTWSPFHVDEEDLKQLNKNSYHRRERTLTDSMINVHQKRLSTASTSSSSDTPHSPMRPKQNKPVEISSSPTLTLEEALHNVVRLLEILTGQYSELRPLEQQITHLDSFLKKNLDKKRRESTISLSVKNALDSFDFLNEIDEGLSDTVDSASMEETNRKNAYDNVDGVAVSSDRLSDSTCIEEDLPSQVELRGIRSPSNNSSVKRSSRFLDLSEKRESRMLELNEQRGNRLLESPADSSFGSMKRLPGSEENLTTGTESIDVTLTHHLMFTEYLLSHLGAFGPLKLKETIALNKLQQQAAIIEQLIVLAVSGVHVSSADEVLPELKLNLPLLEFWEQCREKEALYVNADSFLLQLDVKFGAKLRTNHPEIADDVFHSVCNRIIERPADLMSPKTIITLFQYVSYFTQENRRHPEKCLNDITNEFELTASLEPGRPELLRTIKRIPKGFLLPAGNLRALGLLLLEDSATVQAAVRIYLESIAKEDDIRQKAVTVYLECLEERDLSLRQAGCAALAAMQASESFEQLVYLVRCDIDDVKTTAKEALMAFGEEGRLAYEQVSYSPYVAYEHQYTPNGAPLMTTEL